MIQRDVDERRFRPITVRISCDSIKPSFLWSRH